MNHAIFYVYVILQNNFNLENQLGKMETPLLFLIAEHQEEYSGK